MERFSRIARLLGKQSFSRLQQSRVTVVGIGAVGGYVVEGLARAGVGHLRLIDFDSFEPSNINRQIHALDSTIGRPKVEVAQERIYDINPHCQVEVLSIFVDLQNMAQVLEPAPDLLIDAIDSLDSKVALLTAAWQAKIPLLSAMGAALRRDPTRIRIAELYSSQKCPLARLVRKRLRKAGVGEGIRCVYSMEEVDFARQEGLELKQSVDNNAAPRPLGSLPTVTAIFGLTLANEAINMLSDPT